MTPPIIKLDHINVAYEQKTVLHDVNLTVYERDFLGIIGPNGGGKTTLVKTILGLKRPCGGSITFYRDGHPVPSIRMGYLPQYNRLDKNFPISVYEVVLSGLRKNWFRRYTPAQHNAVKEMLARMGLADLAHRPIGSLSGGQLQRALLGRAIIARPDAVILDEPNTYIDPRFESQLYQLLDDINHDTAIILVSHDLGAVFRNVRSIACVDGTVDYHPDAAQPEEWTEEKFQCPIDLIGHGEHPHRVLKYHKHS